MKRVRLIWKNAKAARTAFGEHKRCLREVYAMADEVLRSPPGTPREYSVRMGRVPASFYSIRKNIFSTLFMSAYVLLNIKRERRLLYGKLNCLFRVWVTAADNLLDDESKTVIPIKFSGESRIMREVVSIMTADRILNKILSHARCDGVISEHESEIISDRSLQVLLPSAAQEAGEEAGISVRPDPEYVFSTIHRYKTGMLFHIPLLGPKNIESDIDRETLYAIKSGMMNFGLGCQLLDDVRDIGRDLREKRHNYVLSLLKYEYPDKYAELLEVSDRERLYQLIPDVALPTVRRGINVMRQGLAELNQAGLGLEPSGRDFIASSMLHALDLGDLEYA